MKCFQPPLKPKNQNSSSESRDFSLDYEVEAGISLRISCNALKSQSNTSLRSPSELALYHIESLVLSTDSELSPTVGLNANRGHTKNAYQAKMPLSVSSDRVGSMITPSVFVLFCVSVQVLIV